MSFSTLSDRFPGFVNGYEQVDHTPVYREFDGLTYRLDESSFDRFRHILGHVVRTTKSNINLRYGDYSERSKYELLNIKLDEAAEDLAETVARGDCVVVNGRTNAVVGSIEQAVDNFMPLLIGEGCAILGEFLAPKFIDYDRIYRGLSRTRGRLVLLLGDAALYDEQGYMLVEYPRLIIPFDHAGITFSKPLES